MLDHWRWDRLMVDMYGQFGDVGQWRRLHGEKFLVLCVYGREWVRWKSGGALRVDGDVTHTHTPAQITA